MLWGASLGALELRSEGGATRLRATFPYGAETELAPGRREIIASRAFAERIEAGGEIHLLSGHDYNRPLASTTAGNLSLRDSDDAHRERALAILAPVLSGEALNVAVADVLARSEPRREGEPPAHRALADAVPTLSRERLKVLIAGGAVSRSGEPARDPAMRAAAAELLGRHRRKRVL